MNSDAAITSALSFFNFLIITILETVFLLYFRKKIKNSIEPSSADIGVIPSFIINIATFIYISNFIIQKYKIQTSIITLPITSIIIFLSDIRVFTYYRNTNFYPIIYVSFSRFIFYNLANIFTIITYKYNPNLSNS